jgi:hypothetical protein
MANVASPHCPASLLPRTSPLNSSVRGPRYGRTVQNVASNATARYISHLISCVSTLQRVCVYVCVEGRLGADDFSEITFWKNNPGAVRRFQLEGGTHCFKFFSPVLLFLPYF